MGSNRPSKNRRFVSEHVFEFPDGKRAVVRFFDDENTVPKSNVEEHQKCVDEMKAVAARIFRNVELRKHGA